MSDFRMKLFKVFFLLTGVGNLFRLEGCSNLVVIKSSSSILQEFGDSTFFIYINHIFVEVNCIILSVLTTF